MRLDLPQNPSRTGLNRCRASEYHVKSTPLLGGRDWVVILNDANDVARGDTFFQWVSRLLPGGCGGYAGLANAFVGRQLKVHFLRD
jgi:hypothetical protein